MRKECLAPVVSEKSRVLILGSLPGEVSLQKQQYYAYRGNQFWEILGAVFGCRVGTNYEERIAFVLGHGLALWDVLKAADREGSLDTSIKNPIPNDFRALLTTYPRISTIVLNGGEARDRFSSVRRCHPEIFAKCRCIELPSTSGVPGKNVLPLQEKIQRWAAITVAKQSHPGDARNARA